MRRGGGEQRRHAGELLAALFPFKEIFLFLFVSLFLFFLPGGAFAAGPPPPPPKPAKYVTDLAGVLPAQRAAGLNETLAAFERETSNQVLVWIDRKIPNGTTLEEFANRAFHAWGVGQKGKSNGVVLFLFTESGRIRMEVGYGLEGALPDARAHRISAEIIGPLFRKGDVAGALDAGTSAILAAARGEPYKGTGRTTAEQRGRAASPGMSPVLYALFPFIFLGSFVIFIAVLIWAVRRSRRVGSSRGSSGWVSGSESSSSSSDFSSSSSSDSSSSSSDFSGGGGDSGGGGSSDGGSSD